MAIAPRLLQAPVDISAGQWFVVMPDDTVTLVGVKRKRAPKAEVAVVSGLSPKLTTALRHLARQSGPVVAGKHNTSGYLSRLKALGLAVNENGKWSITAEGRSALEV